MTLKHRKILAIDDTSSIRTFLRISLQAQGAEFFEADTATLGLDMCREIKPDLVVLDLGLPDRDGLDILAEIKQVQEDGYIPKVLILSVRKEARTKEVARSLGANAYMTKPFLVEELLETIDTTLNSPH